MKSNKRRGSRTGSIVALCIVLICTIVLALLGANGWAIPPRGLYRVMPWLPTTQADSWPQVLPLGLDLRGGMYVEYSAKAPEGSEADFGSLMNGTMSIIQQRLADKGFTEVNVQQIGGDGIRVEIPDVQDDTVLDLIGAAAKLEFRDPNGEVFMTGDMVKTATYYYAEGDHQVAFTLTEEGAKIFADMTAANVGRRISIYLDGEELISPTVQNAITNGSGVINGMGSAERATTIAAKIQSGALPLELTQQKVDKVSATLGRDALSTMLFMLIAVFRIQLTLPGLAGVVLGIGMAVDANVIIFERFNEEIRAGKSVKVAVRTGFRNAMSAILDSNVTTLIAGVVLLIYGTGSIQGFARTLLLGVVVSMFSAILVTRFLMNRLVNAGCVKESLYTKVSAGKEVEAQ